MPSHQRKSLQGKLLIASPRMADSRFDRAVVLVLRHDENGAVGIILNRPMETNAAGPWQLLDILATDRDQKVQIGGPVAGPLIVLHPVVAGEGEQRSTRGGVRIVNKREELEELVQQADAPLRFFVGHAGWAEGQLESEVADGVWLLAPAAADFVFAEHDDMWINAIRESGRAFYREVLGIAQFPDDATVN